MKVYVCTIYTDTYLIYNKIRNENVKSIKNILHLEYFSE